MFEMEKYIEENRVDVTLFITTYNRSFYLRKCLNSAIHQTYKKMIIVVLDNASNDNTEEIVNTYSIERLFYIRHEKNIGGIGNISYALRHCITKYCVIFHDDDVMFPQMIEMERNVLIDNNCTFVSSLCMSSEEIQSINYVDNQSIIKYRSFCGNEYFQSYYQNTNNSILCPSVMFDSYFFQKQNLFFEEEAGPCCDQYLWFQAFRNGAKAVEIQFPLFFHRVHKEQDSIKNAVSMEILLFDFLFHDDYYKNLFFEKRIKIFSLFLRFLKRLGSNYSQGLISRKQVMLITNSIPYELLPIKYERILFVCIRTLFYHFLPNYKLIWSIAHRDKSHMGLY